MHTGTKVEQLDVLFVQCREATGGRIMERVCSTTLSWRDDTNAKVFKYVLARAHGHRHRRTQTGRLKSLNSDNNSTVLTTNTSLSLSEQDLSLYISSIRLPIVYLSLISLVHLATSQTPATRQLVQSFKPSHHLRQSIPMKVSLLMADTEQTTSCATAQ